MKCNNTPKRPPSIAQSFIWITKLEGRIGRAMDPPPRFISFWRNWHRLMDLVDDYHDIYGKSQALEHRLHLNSTQLSIEELSTCMIDKVRIKN